MGVNAEWFGDAFERSFTRAIDQQLLKSSALFRKHLTTALGSAGNSSGGNPPSPDGSNIPFVDTGNRARSWYSSPTVGGGSQKRSTSVYTNLMYAYYLVSKTGKGRRDYMQDGLYWKEKVISLIEKELSSEKLVRIAKGMFRF